MQADPETYPSSIRMGLDILADYWTVLILREMFIGATRWSELAERLEISPSTLNKRLNSLVDAGVLQKTKEIGRRESAYRLTEMGKDVFPFQLASREWALKWDPRPGVFVTPWVHECGLPLRCKDICEACGEDIVSNTIRFEELDIPESEYQAPSPRHMRSSGASARDARASVSSIPKVIEVIGNRRSSLVMAAILRGHSRFDDILRFSQLPPATLSDRLRRLQLLDLVHSRLYQRNPDRYEYFPSNSGAALVHLPLRLLAWSNRWLRDRGAGATRAMHTQCGNTIRSQLVCVHCNKEVRLDDCRLDKAKLKSRL